MKGLEHVLGIFNPFISSEVVNILTNHLNLGFKNKLCSNNIKHGEYYYPYENLETGNDLKNLP